MELDIRGEICPYPMMMALDAMKKVKGKGVVVEVVTDHAPVWKPYLSGARLGFDVAIEATGSPEWKITLTPKELAKRGIA